jgi:hypothetical protein
MTLPARCTGVRHLHDVQRERGDVAWGKPWDQPVTPRCP